ncbi:MAG: hypothetical protein OEO71_13060, partial [Gammaproteobacteria bacterium]|nr:hypothetical protein [Gammaproteobacteria bacterium]
MNKLVINRILLAVVFLLLVYSLYVLPFAEWIVVVGDWSQEHPVAGPITYVTGVAVATILFLPGSVSMMIAG